MLAHRRCGNEFSGGESGTVVPLVTGAASAPRRPCHAGVGHAAHSQKARAKVTGEARQEGGMQGMLFGRSGGGGGGRA